MALSRPAKALILASGQALTTMVSLVSLAVLSRVLDLKQYGTYRQVFLVYRFLAPLLILGLPSALYYFLPGEEKRPRQVLVDNLFLLSLMGFLFSAFLVLGGNRILTCAFGNPALAEHLLLFAAYPLLSFPVRALGACLMARDKPKLVAIFSVASRLLLLVAVLSAALLWRTVAAIVLATVLAEAIFLAAGLLLMFRACPGPFAFPTWPALLSQLKFAVPLGVASLFGVLTLRIGQVIVSAMCSVEDFAIYSNGAFEIPLIGVITGSATAVLMPELSRYVKAGDRQAALTLWQRSMVKCSTILIPTMVFLFICAPGVITLLFSKKYQASVWPFRILLLALPIRAANFGSLYIATNRNELVMYRQVLNLVANTVLTALLVRLLGIVGAALATVSVLYGCAVALNIVFIARMYGCTLRRVIPAREIGRVLLAAAAAGGSTVLACAVFTEAPLALRLGIAAALFAGALTVSFRMLRVREFGELLRSLLPAKALEPAGRTRSYVRRFANWMAEA